MVDRAYVTVGDVAADLQSARVYEFGWQSWTPSTAYAATARRSHQPVTREEEIRAYRKECPRTGDGFQGEGLLAVEQSAEGPTHVFSLRDGRIEVPSIRAQVEDNRIVVSANGTVNHVVDDGADGLYGALARFAERYIAQVEAPSLRQIPRIWASWYHYFTEFTEADLVENLDAMEELGLPVDVVRLDDAFQYEIGDWLTFNDKFSSPPEVGTKILDRGRNFGIWTAPLIVGARSQVYAEHPEWLVRDTDGRPMYALHNWEQDCFALDVTHPQAADYLRTVFATYRECGATYFMADFLYAGALEGRRHDAVSNLTAYRQALKLIRESIGPDSLLQGCGAPMFPSIGLVDSMRVGADIAPQYKSPGGLSEPAQESARISTIGRAFTQGRFWINDPDCFLVRPGVERREDWSELVARYGAVRLSSDRLHDLDSWGVDTTARLLQLSQVGPFDADAVAI